MTERGRAVFLWTGVILVAIEGIVGPIFRGHSYREPHIITHAATAVPLIILAAWQIASSRTHGSHRWVDLVIASVATVYVVIPLFVPANEHPLLHYQAFIAVSAALGNFFFPHARPRT